MSEQLGAAGGMRGALRRRLDALLAAQRPRAGSLAVTIFGDVVSQHGGIVWLGSLVEVMGCFGLNASQVRTAIFRLAQDGWLVAEQRGRRSFYRLAESGRRQYARAAARIYAAGDPAWDGEWLLVMPAGIEAGERDELRKRLGWLGFAVLANGMLAHPRTDEAPLRETLAELDLGARVVVWRARSEDVAPLESLVRGAWQLDDAAARFTAFLARFEPVMADLAAGSAPDARDAFVLRCLLIHEYRRVLLRSVDLPPDLLPRGWPGHRARRLVRDLYARTWCAAAAYARAALRDADGPLPPADSGFRARFGGLPEAAGAPAAERA